MNIIHSQSPKCESRSLVNCVFIAVVVCVCWAGIGCASSGTIRGAGGGVSSDRLTHYDTIGVETVSELANSDQQRKLLHALIISGLQQSAKFEQVAGSASLADSSPHIKLTARISELNKVSDGARVAVGALAGRAGIVVDVELTDSQRGLSLQSFQAVGKSSAGWGGAGTTDQAVQRAAEQVVAEIVKGR